jgi:hypothetical protein
MRTICQSEVTLFLEPRNYSSEIDQTSIAGFLCTSYSQSGEFQHAGESNPVMSGPGNPISQNPNRHPAGPRVPQDGLHAAYA